MKKIATILTIMLITSMHSLAQTYVDVSVANDITEDFGIGYAGGGVSFVDFNNDGWDDLVFASENGDLIHFYENTNGTFSKIATPTGLLTGESKQILWGDYDNDGDKDLFVTCRDCQNRLYQNDGNLVFTDVTSVAGIPTQNDPSFGAAFGDYDKDGMLDLYVCNNNVLNPPDDTYINQLFKNTGGVFADSTAAAGLNLTTDFSFMATFADLNNDSWPDIYVAVDKTYSNILYMNNQDGTFSDLSAYSGADIIIDAMNTGMGDIDNDGDLDIYITNTTNGGGQAGNALLINNGDSTFTESAASCGVDFGQISWAGNFFDCNNDTKLDLFVSSIGSNTPIHHGYFMNNGACNFAYTSANQEPGYSNAYGDFNQDGKIDLALSQGIGFNFKLLENQTTGTGNWLQLQLEGAGSNKDGIGCWVEVWDEGNKQVRYTTAGTAYLNQNTQTQHFGLDTITALDSIIIRWPSGIIDKLLPGDIPGINQKLPTIIEGTYGIPLPLELLRFEAKLSENSNVKLEWKTAFETNFSGFEIQRSNDGRTYDPITWIAAKQKHAISQPYSFVDEKAAGNTMLYYRLKMIDLDGTYTYSAIRGVDLTTVSSTVLKTLFPNPVKHELQLKYQSANEAQMSFRIFNMQGVEVFHTQRFSKKGRHVEKIDLSSLTNGVYILQFETEDSVQSRRFVKMN